MAPKRKSGKRRSKGNGLLQGILIGMAVVAGLGGVGFVGYQVITKVIQPAIAEQKARKLQEDTARAQGRPFPPRGWTTYKYGDFEMFVPENREMGASLMPSSPGVHGFTVYRGRAHGIGVTITTISGMGGGGMFDAIDPSKVASQKNCKVISQRQLGGSPRCLELIVEVDRQPGLIRYYETDYNHILFIAMEGNTKSTFFQEIVSSMSNRTPLR